MIIATKDLFTGEITEVLTDKFKRENSKFTKNERKIHLFRVWEENIENTNGGIYPKDEFQMSIEDYEQTTAEKEHKLDNSNIIKNISFDQSEILWNIMQLYNNGEPYECDMTASELKFYGERKGQKYTIPEPTILFDVYPTQDRIKKITPFNKLPLEDNSIHSIVVDLPFVISPKTCPSMQKKREEGACLIANRFSSWYPWSQAYYNMYWWIKECERVIDNNGIIVWKMQNTVSGSIEHCFKEFAFVVAQKLGLYVIDEFTLEAKARLISDKKYKKQQHARKFTSTFYVFKKDKKLGEKYSCLNIMERIMKEDAEGKVEGMTWAEK